MSKVKVTEITTTLSHCVCAVFNLEKRNFAGKFGLQCVLRPLTLHLTVKVKVKVTEVTVTLVHRVCADFDAKKRKSICNFGLQRVPDRLTLNLTSKVKGQAHRKYTCDTCPLRLCWFSRPKRQFGR